MQPHHHIATDRADATAISVNNPPPALVATIGYGRDEQAEDALRPNATVTTSALAPDAPDMMPAQSTSIHDRQTRITELARRHDQATPGCSPHFISSHL